MKKVWSKEVWSKSRHHGTRTSKGGQADSRYSHDARATSIPQNQSTNTHLQQLKRWKRSATPHASARAIATVETASGVEAKRRRVRANTARVCAGGRAVCVCVIYKLHRHYWTAGPRRVCVRARARCGRRELPVPHGDGWQKPRCLELFHLQFGL